MCVPSSKVVKGRNIYKLDYSVNTKFLMFLPSTTFGDGAHLAVPHIKYLSYGGDFLSYICIFKLESPGWPKSLIEPLRVTITSSLNMRAFFLFVAFFQPEHWVPVHVGGLVGKPKLDIFGECENLLLQFLLFWARGLVDLMMDENKQKGEEWLISPRNKNFGFG